MCGCSAPIPRRASGPYVTGGPGVVDRILRACPAVWLQALDLSPLTLILVYKHSISTITLTFHSGIFSLCPGVLRQRLCCWKAVQEAQHTCPAVSTSITRTSSVSYCIKDALVRVSRRDFAHATASRSSSHSTTHTHTHTVHCSKLVLVC